MSSVDFRAVAGGLVADADILQQVEAEFVAKLAGKVGGRPRIVREEVHHRKFIGKMTLPLCQLKQAQMFGDPGAGVEHLEDRILNLDLLLLMLKQQVNTTIVAEDKLNGRLPGAGRGKMNAPGQVISQ